MMQAQGSILVISKQRVSSCKSGFSVVSLELTPFDSNQHLLCKTRFFLA